MILKTFCSVDGKRKAQIIRYTTGVWIDMFERNDQNELEQLHKVNVSDHSEYYAEDAAENWVTYVIRK